MFGLWTLVFPMKKLFHRVQKRIQPGSVVLFHRHFPENSKRRGTVIAIFKSGKIIP